MESDLPAGFSSFDDMAELFDYDREDPLDAAETAVEVRDGVSVRDLRFVGAPGRAGRQPIKAYRTVPPGNGPSPAVVYVHALPGDRASFLEEAVALGGRGVGAMLIQAPWAHQRWAVDLADPVRAREAVIEVVRDLRRAIDVLEERIDVDTARLGFVGHSLGALCGGTLSGAERRIGAFVLVAGISTFGTLASLNAPEMTEQARRHYREVIAPVDPVHYVARAAPAALFFQFGRKDPLVPRGEFERFAAAGSEPKRVSWYDTDHYFKDASARADRLDWLTERLTV